MIPTISNYAQNAKAIPSLSGGINLKNDATLIKDEQLTDGLNVWFQNGALKTRPGVTYFNETEYIKEKDNFNYLNSKPNCKGYVNIIRIINGTEYFLVVEKGSTYIEFKYCAADVNAAKKIIRLARLPDDLYKLSDNEIDEEDSNFHKIFQKRSTYNVFQHNEDIYCVFGYLENNKSFIYKIQCDVDENNNVKINCSHVKDEEIYAPLVMKNGRTAAGNHEFKIGANFLSQGDFFEGYNLIGSYYKMSYSTVNKDKFGNIDNLDYSQPATYELLKPVIEGKKVIVKITGYTYTKENGEAVPTGINTVEHSVVITNPEEWNEESEYKEDNIKIKVKGRTLVLWDAETDNQKVYKYTDFVNDNNLEITAPFENTEERLKKVVYNTFNTWYGGGAEGLYGGIHLFFGGNTKSEEKNILLWSDFNKPLYFSENNYAYVGNKSQRVTAFGKQGENLIVFKEREVWATKYISADEVISAESVSNQSVIDVSAFDASFPMTQVHGYIGCDCPDTVQLCRNRLVWAHSDGKIYTLVSANQYNEKTIYEISDMIEPLLKNFSANDIKKSHSADWKGHYVISISDKIFLMDYNSSGFSYVYSYQKEESAQTNIPWWVWEAPKHFAIDFESTNEYETAQVYKPILIKSLVSIGGNLFITAGIVSMFYKRDYAEDPFTRCYFIVAYLQGEKDILPGFKATRIEGKDDNNILNNTELSVNSMFQTKFFDFGLPTIKKNVFSIELTIQGNNGEPIRFSTITEKGKKENIVVISTMDNELNSIAKFKNIKLRPQNKHNYKIGLKCECDRNIDVGAIILHYKRLGGLK